MDGEVGRRADSDCNSVSTPGGQQSLERIAGAVDAGFRADGDADAVGGFGRAQVGEKGGKFPGGSRGRISLTGEGATDAEPDHSRRVVELIVGEGNHQHGPARAKRLGSGADSALMDQGRGTGKNLRVRQVVPRENRFSQSGRRRVVAQE